MLNNPILFTNGSIQNREFSMFEIKGKNVMVDAVKKAEVL